MGLRFRLRILADRLHDALIGVPMGCSLEEGNARRDSPRDELRFEVGGRPALLCYGRPAARGRPIFGDLVPFGELWRTGADEPTVLHLPFRATVAGVPLGRGRYSIYTIPGEARWTLVINRATRQSGRTREETGKRGTVFPNAYTEAVRAQEIARVPVEVESVPHSERLTARTDVVSPSETTLRFEWESVSVMIPIRV